MAISRLTGFPSLPDDPNAAELTGRSGTEYGDFVTPNPERFAIPGEETVAFVPDTSDFERRIDERRNLPTLRPGPPDRQLTPHLEHPRLAAEREAGDDQINNPLDFIHLDAMEHSPYGGLRESAELGRLLVKVDRERRGYPTSKKDSRFLLRGQYDALKLEAIRGELPELRSFFNKRPGASMSPREMILVQEWMQLLEGNFKPASIPQLDEVEQAMAGQTLADLEESEELEEGPSPEEELEAMQEQITREERASAEARQAATDSSPKGYHVSAYDGPEPPKPPDPPMPAEPPLRADSSHRAAEKHAVDDAKKQERENREHAAKHAADAKPAAKDPATLERERLQKKADSASKRQPTPIDQVNVMPIKADGVSFTPPSLLGKSPQSRPKPWWSTRTGFDPTKDPFIRIDSLPDGTPEKRLAQFILGTGMMGGLGLRGIDGELCATDMRFFLDEQQHGMDPMMQKTWVNLWKMLDYPETQEVGDPREEPGPEVIDWYRSTHNPAADAARTAQYRLQGLTAAQQSPPPRDEPRPERRDPARTESPPTVDPRLGRLSPDPQDPVGSATPGLRPEPGVQREA